MRRLLALSAALLMVLCLATGCDNEKKKSSGDSDDRKANTTETGATETAKPSIPVLDYGPYYPVGVFAVEDALRNDAYWAQETDQQELNSIFYSAREKFFDYFYSLWGFSNLSQTGAADGRFSDKELLHSICTRLYMEDESTVFSKIELMTAGKRYFGQTVRNLSACGSCSYNKDAQTYTWNSGCIAAPGNYMILRQLTVQEDGVCTAIFDRSHESHYTGDSASDSKTLRETLLNGCYDELSQVDTVILTFRECKTDDGQYYLQIFSIYPYTGPGAHTK